MVFVKVKYHAMKTYWGTGGIDPNILNLSNRICILAKNAVGKYIYSNWSVLFNV
jgi:hypothetical protein